MWLTLLIQTISAGLRPWSMPQMEDQMNPISLTYHKDACISPMWWSPLQFCNQITLEVEEKQVVLQEIQMTHLLSLGSIQTWTLNLQWLSDCPWRRQKQPTNNLNKTMNQPIQSQLSTSSLVSSRLQRRMIICTMMGMTKMMTRKLFRKLLRFRWSLTLVRRLQNKNRQRTLNQRKK